MKERRIVKGREYVRELTRNLNIRCSDEHLERWRSAADKAGVGLSEWMREKLDKAESAAQEKPQDNTIDGLLKRIQGK